MHGRALEVNPSASPHCLLPVPPRNLQSPQLWHHPANVPGQPSPPPGALFLPRPPSHCCRLPPLIAQPPVPGLIILSYPISPRNDILLALTPAPPPPANQANVYTPVRQSASCCSCPLISPSTPVFILRLGAPCTKDFLFAAWEARSV